MFMLEYRPYTEELEFWGTNPGMEWQIADKLKTRAPGQLHESDFYREGPTVLLIYRPTTVHLHQQRRNSVDRVERRRQRSGELRGW